MESSRIRAVSHKQIVSVTVACVRLALSVDVRETILNVLHCPLFGPEDIKMRIATISAVVGLLSLIPIGADADELEPKVRRITIGMDRSAVIALMGSSPDATINANTVSIAHSRMVWMGQAGRSYVVVTVFDRVIRIKACSGILAAQC
jgi:hypothetical protein